jgi:cysteinyl-tRNA synthetase
MINTIFHAQNGLIDIHGGGFDLKFPHHENEMAQAKAHNHNKLANYWVHNGFINANNEKMSKSLGNVILMKDVVKEYGGLPFRLMVLAAHYRAPASFSEDTILEAQVKYQQLKESVKKASIVLQLKGLKILDHRLSDESPFLDAICDDLNTPNALAILYEENKNLNNILRQKPLDYFLLHESLSKVRAYEEILGLGIVFPELTADDKRLYQEYDEAKGKKDFAKSDELRGILIKKGLF